MKLKRTSWHPSIKARKQQAVNRKWHQGIKLNAKPRGHAPSACGSWSRGRWRWRAGAPPTPRWRAESWAPGWRWRAASAPSLQIRRLWLRSGGKVRETNRTTFDSSELIIRTSYLISSHNLHWHSGVHSFQMYPTRVSYLVNEHDGKDRVVQTICGAVMDTRGVALLSINSSEWCKSECGPRWHHRYLRKRQDFFNQHVHLGPLICTHNDPGGLQSGKSDAVKRNCDAPSGAGDKNIGVVRFHVYGSALLAPQKKKQTQNKTGLSIMLHFEIIFTLLWW